MKIYMLRHGETDWTNERRIQGRTDIPLNHRGMLQIHTAGEYLLCREEKIDVIISSPLSRAFKSAEITADILGYKKEDIIIEQGFIERNFGMAEGLSYDEYNIKYHDKYCPGIESIKELCKRADNAIKQSVKKYFGRTLLITSHGAILKAVLESVSNGRYPYGEKSSALNTGEFCLLEYDEETFQVINAKINPNDMNPKTVDKRYENVTNKK